MNCFRSDSKERPTAKSALKKALGVPNALYRIGAGRLLGHRFLQLTHTGRSTGTKYRVVIEVMRYDRATGEAVVMAGFGPRSGWLRNLRAGGPAWVDFGRGPARAQAHILSTGEASTVLRDYERRMRLLRPIVRGVLGRLAGFTYQGSAADRERVVSALPLVALVPSPATAKGQVRP